MKKFFLSLLVALFSASASASLMTVCYQGELFLASDGGNRWNGEFVAGDNVKGCYSFESETQPNQLDSTAATFYGAIKSFSFGSIFATATTSGSEQLNQIHLYNDDPVAGDSYSARARNDRGTDPYSDDDISFQIGGPGSLNLDAIKVLSIMELPKLSKYEPDPLEVWFWDGTNSYAAAYLRNIHFVPEPGSLALLGLGLAGLAFARRRKR